MTFHTSSILTNITRLSVDAGHSIAMQYQQSVCLPGPIVIFHKCMSFQYIFAFVTQ